MIITPRRKKIIVGGVALISTIFVAILTVFTSIKLTNNKNVFTTSLPTTDNKNVSPLPTTVTTFIENIPEYLGPIRGDLPDKSPKYYFYRMYTNKAIFIDSEDGVTRTRFPSGEYRITAVRSNSNKAGSIIFHYNNETQRKDFKDGFVSLQAKLHFLQTTSLSIEYIGELTDISFFVYRED